MVPEEGSDNVEENGHAGEAEEKLHFSSFEESLDDETYEDLRSDETGQDFVENEPILSSIVHEHVVVKVKLEEHNNGSKNVPEVVFDSEHFHERNS